MIIDIHTEDNKDFVFNKVQHFLQQNDFKISNKENGVLTFVSLRDTSVPLRLKR